MLRKKEAYFFLNIMPHYDTTTKRTLRNLCKVCGRDSSVGIATRYGLDGPGIESLWGRGFPHPFRQALGPTHPPVQWVPGISRG